MDVLVITFDGLRHDYLAFSGHPYVKTPNLDALVV